MTTATKRITVATVKSFIRKNRANLLVTVKSKFDSMEDMVTYRKGSTFHTAKPNGRGEDDKHSLGINGVWFVGRDLCEAIETDTVRGFEVYNCCGTWQVAVAK